MEMLLAWLLQIRHPIQTLNYLFDEQPADSRQITFAERLDSRVVSLWGKTFTIAIAVQWIVFAIFRIESSEQILLLYQLTVVFIALANVCVLFVLLRSFKVAVHFWTVVTCYSVVVLFDPIEKIAVLASWYRVVLALQQVKAQNLDLQGSLGYVACHMVAFGKLGFANDSWIMTVSGWASRILTLLTSVLLAEAISQVALARRIRVYFAVSAMHFISVGFYLASLFLQSLLLVVAMK